MAAVSTANTVDSIMAELEQHGSAQTRKIYSRHGLPPDRMYGVSMAQLKLIAKKLKGQHDLALNLYATGNVDAMYLAGLVADGSRMSKKQLNDWAQAAAGMQMISEYSVPWVASESSHGRLLALDWIKSKKAHVATSGWCTYGALVSMLPDAELDLKEVESLLQTIVKEIDGVPNRVRHTMNGFIIAVGGYVKPLNAAARKAAKQIGTVSVDMGETACKVPDANAYIDKMIAAGKAFQKRKSVRC